MKAQILSISFSLLLTIFLYEPVMAGKKDFSLYFEQDLNGIISIRVKASYYVKTGDTDSRKAAEFATQFWNKQSGEFKLRIGDKNSDFEYTIYFDLGVVEVGDPAAEMRKDKTGAANATTSDGSSNSFMVVDDSYLGKSAGKTFGCNSIKIKQGMKYDPQVGAHEIGHTLLIEHAGTFSLSVMANGATGSNFVLSKDVRQIIVAAFNTPTLNRITVHGLPASPVSKTDMKIYCNTKKKSSRGYLKSLANVE